MNNNVTQTLPDEYYKWIEELQELDFVLVELTLYLDTHPDDTIAINQFNDFSYKRRVLQQKIEGKYGPLQQFGNSYSNAPWEWSKGPWPWQI
ncbi:spore coat protein CotJB [Bacillus cereus]|uniref:Spore coat protein CotJB n=1 Tax=Bacillus cereus TaxID=1396 RepID=A0A2A8R9G6_BACCE|nr:spore coat protein CotJB [Bacillus cereus]PFN29347.1 spore coat protein CotJB [Bacillus cereus]